MTELKANMNQYRAFRTMQQYKEANRERINEQKKQYYEENKEQILEKQKKYKKENEERINERNRARYHAKKQSIAASASLKLII